MKLRNKKTGEIINAVFTDTDFMSAEDIANCPCDEVRYYHSLAELNADWEDYTPQEPRIEDEKVRKVVKQWLMISLDNHMNIFFDKYMNGFYLYEENSDRSVAGITFPDNIKFNLEHDKYYTFAELCGEEE